jgi:hypothetical protein
MKQLIQFWTEYMQEYLYNDNNTFFATTTTTPTNRSQRLASSNKTTWKQTHWRGGSTKDVR